ncbi:MAG: zinc-binding dehydrogenase [SAR202 cluster bacterium]|nr:zinc-binding dehydrogenase [SAR202 cluster bacterium]
MKIAMLRGPRDLVIEEHPLDTKNLKPDEIWVETEISALKIGTDRGNYEGAENVPGAPTYPRWVGDSNLGTVRGVGKAVARFKVGDRVITRAPHTSEYLMSTAKSIVKVPEGVDSEDAVWAHLYTLSGLCYRKANFVPGETVAVVGVGVLGLGAVALGPLMGARVVALANSPIRAEMAKKMGAHETMLSDDPDLNKKLEKFTHGNGIDLVILTANPWPAYKTSMEIVRNNGRVSIVSLLGRGEAALDFNPLAMEWFYNKGVSIIAVNGTHGYMYPSGKEDRFSWDRQCEYVIDLMKDGRLHPKDLVTHRFSYKDIKVPYEMIYRREKNMLGVIFTWKD